MLRNESSTSVPPGGGSRIEQMFSGIAPYYDFLNRLLSLRRDVLWRRELVQGILLPPTATVLDLAAGTLDVSLEIIRQQPGAWVVAADFSLPMLRLGQAKLRDLTGAVPIFPVAADAYALPFSAGQFDAVTIAFGIRNLPDRPQALAEMHRVLKPGGTLAILEFTPPQTGWLQNLYRLYLDHLLPLVGRLFSQHAFAYSYLAESIHAFPSAEQFRRQMQAAGFEHPVRRDLTLGVVSLFYGQKSVSMG